jgi:hypothetical protein
MFQVSLNNPRATCNFQNATLPIVPTSTSTYYTYFWKVQNTTIDWTAYTQAAPAFSNSLLFPLLFFLTADSSAYLFHQKFE